MLAGYLSIFGLVVAPGACLFNKHGSYHVVPTQHTHIQPAYGQRQCLGPQQSALTSATLLLHTASGSAVVGWHRGLLHVL